MKKIIYISSYLFPSLIFAQVTGAPSRLLTLIMDFGGIVRIVTPVIFGLIIVYFFWNTANFILKDAGNEKTRKEGIRRIVWSVVAIFVFVSIYGLIDLLGQLIDFN